MYNNEIKTRQYYVRSFNYNENKYHYNFIKVLIKKLNCKTLDQPKSELEWKPFSPNPAPPMGTLYLNNTEQS